MSESKKIPIWEANKNKGRKEYVYFMRDNDLIKIGRSCDPKRRLFEIRMEKTKHIKLLDAIVCPTFEQSCLLEKALHKYHASKRANGEWFLADAEMISFIEDVGKYEDYL